LAFSTSAQADQAWNGNGGSTTDSSDTWDWNTTPDWTPQSTASSTWQESYDPSGPTVINGGDGANFDTVGGTITLDDSAGPPVAADHLDFNNGGNGAYTLTGDTLYTTGGLGGEMINVQANSSAVTINNVIEHVGGDNQNINNNSSNDLTINGDIDYNHQTTLFMTASGTGKIIINGSFTNASESGLYLLGGGTYEFGVDSDMSFDSVHNNTNLSLIALAGTVLLDRTLFFPRVP
jgi:hypothetical protein